ncbi:hypothetical protein [Methylobacterium symbioticum]|nr:hypothetical protein [Methylobacterium symbioticum]
MNLSTSIITVLLTFLCTGLMANWLIQRWQYRNWLNQQRFLGAEKQYEALKAVADDISKVSAKRLSAMFRVLSALDQSADRLEERRKIYSDAVDEWNQNINSFQYKTTLYFNWGMTQRLEHDINENFVKIGGRIERNIRIKQINDQAKISDKQEILSQLFKLQGILGNFHRDMLNVVLQKQASTYQGVEIGYNESDLQYFSTWQLIKALFITRVELFRIVLTSFELEKPARRRH